MKKSNKTKRRPTKKVRRAAKTVKDPRASPSIKVGKMKMKERRKDFRKPAENEIVITYLPPESGPECGRILPGIAKNISAGGMKIVITEEIPPNAVVNVQFTLPNNGKAVDLKGRVKWVWSLDEGRGFEMGLEFVAPASESLLDLLEYTYKK